MGESGNLMKPAWIKDETAKSTFLSADLGVLLFFGLYQFNRVKTFIVAKSPPCRCKRISSRVPFASSCALRSEPRCR